MKIKIAIVDDHPMLLKGLQGMLSCASFIEVTGIYRSGKELLEGIAQQQPDILILDIQMPDQKGDELSVILHRQYPDMKILAFTNQEQNYYIRTMMENGVMGYVLKTSDEATLLEAIQTVYDGEHYYDPMISNQVAQVLQSNGAGPKNPRLTKREKEILQLIAQNYNSKDIAARLCMGKRTVDNYRIALLLKLDVKNSASLVKTAIDLGLIG
jgi:DNA-binding NarL/FixJ family response regulator